MLRSAGPAGLERLERYASADQVRPSKEAWPARRVATVREANFSSCVLGGTRGACD